MRILWSMAIICFLALVVLPVPHQGHAINEAELQKMKNLLAQENARKFVRNRKKLISYTKKLKRQSRKDWREQDRGRYTKRVDRDFIERLEDIAKLGHVEEWKQVNAEYKVQRDIAIAKDIAAAEKKAKNVWRPKNP